MFFNSSLFLFFFFKILLQKDLYVFKKSVSAKIVADIGVGVSVLQYQAENIVLYDFTIGNMASNPCATKTTQSTCVGESTCGWCQSTNKCFEKRPDSRTGKKKKKKL